MMAKTMANAITEIAMINGIDKAVELELSLEYEL